MSCKRNSFLVHYQRPRDLCRTSLFPPAYKFHQCSIIQMCMLRHKLCRTHRTDEFKAHMSAMKLTWWLAQVSGTTVALYSVWMSGMFKRLQCQEMPLVWGADIRIDIPQPASCVLSNSLCGGGIKLVGLYTCEPPLTYTLYIFYPQVEKKGSITSDIV